MDHCADCGRLSLRTRSVELPCPSELPLIRCHLSDPWINWILLSWNPKFVFLPFSFLSVSPTALVYGSYGQSCHRLPPPQYLFVADGAGHCSWSSDISVKSLSLAFHLSQTDCLHCTYSRHQEGGLSHRNQDLWSADVFKLLKKTFHFLLLIRWSAAESHHDVILGGFSSHRDQPAASRSAACFTEDFCSVSWSSFKHSCSHENRLPVEKETHTDQCYQQGVCSLSSGITYSAWPAQPLAGYSTHRAWNQTQPHAAEGSAKNMEGNGGEFRKNIGRHTAYFQIGHNGQKQWI